MRTFGIIVAVLALVLLAGCGLVPGSGDTASDAAAAQNFVPETIPGYNSSDATSVTDALSKAGIATSILSGTPTIAAAIAKLDGMIQCYRGVGAVAARVYTEQNMQGIGIPKIGVLAVINTTRISRNFLQCALSFGGASAQADEIQPCGGSGSKVVDGETLEYVYGATTPELCTVFQQQFN